jgi:membrane protein DedA with SNARE-associated domain
LKKWLKPKRFEAVKKQMSRRAGFAILLACLAPPPFPFTPVIAAASAFEYPRHHLFSLVFAGRVVRFSLVGLAAIFLGQEILDIARSPGFYWAVVAFAVFCGVGSVISVAGWIRRSR